MTRTSWPSPSRRSARWEPMNPPPPVIRTFIHLSFRGQQRLEARLPVVERLLPELEAHEPPDLATEASLPVETCQHLRVVEQRALARCPAGQRIDGEFASLTAQPLRERDWEPHLVLALRDH